MERLFFAAGAASGFVSVAAGAFGAHALRTRLAPDLMAVFETAVKYQLAHALALLACGLAMGRGAGLAAVLAGFFFLLGTVLFSGSLYALALSGVRALGALTPLGGLAFLAGWVALFFAAFAMPRR
ncbi:MAG TPA: DUF423 domain-containing protein [Anaeromyxobacter sp.]|nr:DUF423 domain-containing protein [Anaeromyxobacter sp.]